MMKKLAFGCYAKVLCYVIFLLLLIGSTDACRSQSIDHRLSKANSLFFEKDYTNALPAYNQLLTELTDSVDLSNLYCYAAICSEKLKDTIQAYGYYKNAVAYRSVQMSVYNKLYSLAGKRNDMACQEFVLLQKIGVFPSEQKESRKKLAYLYAATRQYSKLLKLAEQLLYDEPANHEYHYLKGVALQNFGETEMAEQSLRKALEMNPDDYAANVNLGLLLFNRASAAFDKDQAEYEKVNDPTWNEYLVYLQKMKQIKAMYNEAEPYLSKACQMNCNDSLKRALEILKSRTAEIKG
ncbi:tetratricopeptide repeat protein [Gaoshiqia sp. Z1-71]|uniref:tetratricopeptide repeat protein n=1 Tax=Gaoshiqia hydrogeniformans TaxID=3290090 RepID=UPI003BF7AEEC